MKRLQVTTQTEMFGHDLRIWQAPGGGYCVLQVNDLFFVGYPNERGDLVLPKSLPCVATFEVAEKLAMGANANAGL